MAQHTQGPWRYEAPDEVSIKDAEGGRLAILTFLRGALGTSGRRDMNEVVANARLIAAAPDLLKALAGLVARYAYDGIPNDSLPAVEAARAAMAKAEGVQQ